jgi:hypothetical protein
VGEEEEELAGAERPEACLSSRGLLLLAPGSEQDQEEGDRTERTSTRIMSLEASAVATTKRIIFPAFHKVGFVILAVRVGLITITYESEAYCSHSFEFLSMGTSMIAVC